MRSNLARSSQGGVLIWCHTFMRSYMSNGFISSLAFFHKRQTTLRVAAIATVLVIAITARCSPVTSASPVPLITKCTLTVAPAYIGLPVGYSMTIGLTRPVTDRSKIRLIAPDDCTKPTLKIRHNDSYSVQVNFVYIARPPAGEVNEAILIVNSHNYADVLGQLDIVGNKVNCPKRINGSTNGIHRQVSEAPNVRRTKKNNA
jgi:hypothetical protein